MRTAAHARHLVHWTEYSNILWLAQKEVGERLLVKVSRAGRPGSPTIAFLQLENTLVGFLRFKTALDFLSHFTLAMGLDLAPPGPPTSCSPFCGSPFGSNQSLSSTHPPFSSGV